MIVHSILFFTQIINVMITPQTLILAGSIFTAGFSISYSYFRLNEKISILNEKMENHIISHKEK